MLTSTIAVLLLLFQAAAPPRPATVSGQVRMSDGSPAAAVRVTAIPAPAASILPLQGQNYYSAQMPAATALTDDNGRYRLANVPPGRYFIVAGLIGYATYYPATTDINDATVLTLDGQRAFDDIDLALVQSPGARVSGRVSPPPAPDVQERATLAGVALGELLETPINADGTFEFGRVPRGDYVLNVSPTPAGMASLRFAVADRDVTSLQATRPPVRTVRGRVVADRGPLPFALLAFYTPQSHVSPPIDADGTFTVGLHAARHQVDLAGMPIGYEVASVRVGSRDVTASGLQVANEDVGDVVITVSAPERLPRLTGRVTGAAGDPSALRVELAGPIVGRASAAVRPDGTFEFPALPPGTYRLTIPQAAAMPPQRVIVTSDGSEVTVPLPSSR